MPLDDVVILDIDKKEIELPGDCCDDVDDLPPEAVSRSLINIGLGEKHGDADMRVRGHTDTRTC